MPITIQNWINADQRNFRFKKQKIRDALDRLETGMLNSVTDLNKPDVFYMLCFCLAVPQSRQSKTEEAIEQLRQLDLYNRPMSAEQIAEILRPKCRFHNKKGTYIALARKVFFETSFWDDLKVWYREYCSLQPSERFDFLMKMRQRLSDLFKGMSMKEASHFLRNCGMRGLAILDLHVVRAMLKRELISDGFPLTKAKYLVIEKQVMAYAQQLGLEIDELDQLFWSGATGYVGK